MTDPYDLAKAVVMLTGYDAMWAEAMKDYEVLGVETEFNVPLGNSLFSLAGKTDATIVEKATGRRGVVEHKTTSQDASPGSDYMKLLRLNPQVSIYTAATGADFVLYDVLVKPGLRPLKANSKRATAETPDEYRDRMASAVAESPSSFYLRAEVVRLDSELQQAMKDVEVWADRLAHDQMNGWFPRNPDACVRYGTTCEHFGVCCGEEEHENNERFVSTDPHQELANADGACVTASRLAAYRACPRLHHYRYHEGWRARKESDALTFGTLIHKGLEAWWKADDGKRLDAALAAVR